MCLRGDRQTPGVLVQEFLCLRVICSRELTHFVTVTLDGHLDLETFRVLVEHTSMRLKVFPELIRALGYS